MRDRDSIAVGRAALLLTLAAAASLALGTGVARAAGAAQAASAPRVVHAASAAVRTIAIPSSDSQPTGIVVGPDGNLYFAEYNGYRIGRVTPAGQLTEFPVPVGPYNSASDEGPVHLVSSGGYLWFTSDAGESVYRMTTSGALASVDWDGHDAIGLGPSDTGGVWIFDALATDDDGSSIDLQRVDPSGTITPYLTDDSNQVYAPLALASGGGEWYGEDLVDGQYLVEQTDSGTETKYPIVGSDFTYEVTSMAFSTNGTLWFTEHQEHDHGNDVGGAVGVLTPGAGSAKLALSEPDTENLSPENLTAGAGGVMYFTWSEGLGEISPSGHVTLATLAGHVPTGLVDDGGELWFVDANENTVDEVSATALFGGSAGGSSAPKPTLTAPRQTLRTVRTARSLTARCALRSAGRCTVTADITAASAHALHLEVARHAKTVRLARRTTTLRKRGTATLHLRLSSKTANALRRVHTLKVTLTATGAPRTGHGSSHAVTRKLTLHS